MPSTGVYFNLLLVVGSALTASLPFRRTSLFNRALQKNHLEALIASRQIRNGIGAPLGTLEEDSSPVAPAPVEEPVSAPGSLKFHEKPPSQKTVALYDRLELSCVVSGVPPPLVYWLKNGQPIRESPYEMEELTNKIVEVSTWMPDRALASTKSRLVIDCADGDIEAIYTCVAESQKERIVSSTYVHIEGEAPYNETVCSRHETDLLPASIFMWSGTYIDAQDQDAVLLCRAAGNPHPKITWIDNEDKVIKNYHGDFQILPTGDLKIRRLNWQKHMGLYKCRAENVIGHETVVDETSTFLYPVVPDES